MTEPVLRSGMSEWELEGDVELSGATRMSSSTSPFGSGQAAWTSLCLRILSRVRALIRPASPRLSTCWRAQPLLCAR